MPKVRGRGPNAAMTLQGVAQNPAFAWARLAFAVARFVLVCDKTRLKKHQIRTCLSYGAHASCAGETRGAKRAHARGHVHELVLPPGGLFCVFLA